MKSVKSLKAAQIKKSVLSKLFSLFIALSDKLNKNEYKICFFFVLNGLLPGWSVTGQEFSAFCYLKH